MSEKLAFCLLLIRIQGGIKDRLKVGGGGSVGVNLGHGLCLGREEVDRRERGNAASCSIPLIPMMATDMERRAPALEALVGLGTFTTSELILLINLVIPICAGGILPHRIAG